jgi:hypothetical protein
MTETTNPPGVLPGSAYLAIPPATAPISSVHASSNIFGSQEDLFTAPDWFFRYLD